MKIRPIVHSVHVYPLKSARGFSPRTWQLEWSGFLHDRRWMLVDAEGRSVTQLSNRRIVLVQPSLGPDTVTFHAPGLSPISHETRSLAADRVRVCLPTGENLEAALVSPELDGWFSEALREACRIVDCAATSRRVEGEPESPVRFQNAFPVHLVARESLDELNSRLMKPVAMDRFRPNIVISGLEPHEDDSWCEIRIDNVNMIIARSCDHRCGVPNIDQKTGQASTEPLKTLSTYRRSDRGIYFGQNCLVTSGGQVSVGDEVEVLRRGEGLDERTRDSAP